jgi:hypothetical protein
MGLKHHQQLIQPHTVIDNIYSVYLRIYQLLILSSAYAETSGTILAWHIERYLMTTARESSGQTQDIMKCFEDSCFQELCMTCCILSTEHLVSAGIP